MRRRRVLKQHFPAKLLPGHTGAGKTNSSCSVLQPGWLHHALSQKAQGWGKEMLRAVGTAEMGTVLPGNPSGSLLRSAWYSQDPCSKPGLELLCRQQLPAKLQPRRQAETPSLSWGVPGKTHPACQAPPPRGPCCAGSA